MRSVRLDLHLNPGELSSGGRNRFRPGELVSGWLDVECLEPTRCRSIIVGVQPHVVGPHSNDGCSRLPRRLLFRGELPAGKQRFPFSMPLPAGPISHEGEFASLSWRLHAALDRAAPLHDLLLPGFVDERFDLVPWSAREVRAPRVERPKAEFRSERLDARWTPPWIDHGSRPGLVALIRNDLGRLFGLAAPWLVAPKRLTLGDSFEVFCLWPRGWAHPRRVDAEIAALESRVTHPRSGYLPPLVEHAYPFGVAAELESVPLAEVPAVSDTRRKQFGEAFRARLRLPEDALPTHPLIFWSVRLRARGGKNQRNVSGTEPVWECESVVDVLPWWGDPLSTSLSVGTRSTPVLDKSVKVSEAA